MQGKASNNPTRWVCAVEGCDEAPVAGLLTPFGKPGCCVAHAREVLDALECGDWKAVGDAWLYKWGRTEIQDPVAT